MLCRWILKKTLVEDIFFVTMLIYWCEFLDISFLIYSQASQAALVDCFLRKEI